MSAILAGSLFLMEKSMSVQHGGCGDGEVDGGVL